MCKCRIILFILSLAIIASIFTFSVSADSLPFFQIVWSYSDDGSTWTQFVSDANDGIIGSSVSDHHSYWRLDGLRFYNGNTNQSEFMMAFSITTYDSVDVFFTSGDNYIISGTGWSGQKKGVVYTSLDSQTESDRASWYMYGVNANVSVNFEAFDNISQIADDDYLDRKIGVTGYTYYVRLKSNYSTDGNAQTYFKLNAPVVLRCKKQNESSFFRFKPLLYNCTYFENTNVLLNSLFDSIHDDLALIVTRLNSFISSFNQSLTNPYANEYGQMDAYEAGMDAADDLGGTDALSSFNSIGNVASWDSGTYGSQSTTGLLSWFSQSNKEAIQNIPLNRNDYDFVDYSSFHFQSYISAINPSKVILSGEEDEDS